MGNEAWAAFLGFAEVLREAAERARLLDPRETWKAPQGRDIPAPENPPEINPLSPKYRLQIAAWKRLPLWFANSVGPVISRGLG